MKHFVPVVVGVIVIFTGLALYGSVALSEWVHDQETDSIETEFKLIAKVLTENLLRNFLVDGNKAETIARAVSIPSVAFTRTQWSSLVDVYLTQVNNLRVINLLRVISHEDRRAFEHQISQELGENKTITQLGSEFTFVPAAERDVYYPVTFIHPQTPSNTPVLMLDLGAFPDLRSAVQTSIASNQTVFSAPVQLLQDTSSAGAGVTVQSFAILCPIYRDAKLYGLVEMVDSFGDLLLLFFGPSQVPHTGVEILDCTDELEPCWPLQRVSRDNPGVFFNADINEEFAFSSRNEVHAGGRKYLLRVFATEQFARERESNAGVAVLASCVVASFTIPLLTLSLLLLKHRQDAIAKDNEARVLAAETSAKVKYSFVNYLFHEIRVPLNSTSIALQSILDQYARISENLWLLEKANVTLDHAIVVLNSVLDLEKMTQGSMTLHRQWFSMGQLLQECHHMNTHEALSKSITLSVEDLLPALDILFYGDRVRLLQCLMNYTSNALKYTDGGGNVVLRAQLTDVGHLRVEVQDNGVGIAPDQVPGLFQQYKRLQDNEHKLDLNSGLGLSIVHALVTLHGGRCGCSSKPNLGSTFWFDIPLPCRTGRPVHPIESKTSVEMTTVQKLKVLVVDDDPVGREVMSEVLKRKNFEVAVCADGSEAVSMEMDRLQTFDVILMDKTMPQMNGVRATEELQNRGVTVPVVGLTGNALQRDIEEFYKAGVVTCLTKPVNMELLVRTLQETAQEART